MKKWIPLLFLCSVLVSGAFSFSHAGSQEENGKALVKNLLHEIFAEEEKKYPALKAHLNDESKKTFQEAHKIFKAKPPSMSINYIRGSKQWYITNTGIAEIISAPRITSIVPADKIEANNMLTIFGENLQNAREVTFSGVKGSISVSEFGVIRVIVPNVEGQKRIYAVTPTGTAKWDYCNIFKLKPPPAWTPPPVAKPTPPPAPPVPPAPVPPKPDPITKNALGNPELCFGAVGKGCGGFGDLKDDETKATRPGSFTAGCSEEVNGMRRCWVVPGSIKHDNCCVGHPHGKHCGGPMSDGSNAGEWNHDKNCVQEWDDAVWDVKNGRGWEVDFVAKKPGDLTPASSPSGRYSGGERVGTVDLCAPDTASISARHNVAFCCSRNAKKYWALGVEDWYICEKSGRSIQQIGGKEEGTPTQVDMSKAPSKPGEPKRQPVAVTKQPDPAVISFAPVITNAPASAEPEANITIQGKNFTRVDGKMEMSNVKEVFWVKDKTETKGQGVTTMASMASDSISLKAPKEPGNYSLKVVTAKGSALWDKPLVSVVKKALPPPKVTKIPPSISRVEPAKARPGDVVSLYGQNLGQLKKITIGEKIVSTVGKGDNNSVLVTVPDFPAGKYEVTASNNEGTGKWGNHFQILNVPRLKPAPPKAPPVAKKRETPKIKPQPALLPPPPLPSKTVEKEAPQEPEIAVRNEPPEETQPEHCENGTWSPTLRTCIKDQAPEEAAPPECPGGTHWSPTLKSCQPD